MDSRQFKLLRQKLEEDVADEYVGDPDRRGKLGSDQYRSDVRERYRAGNVLLDSDTPEAAPKNYAGLAKTGALAGLALAQGAASAFRSGQSMGQAAGALVSGLGDAVTGAASGFARVGESVLGLILSPFGKGGAALAGLAGGAVSGLVSLLSGGVGVAAAGVKIGVGLIGGIAAGLASVAGAGIGGLLGGILGSVLPGGGSLAGAVLGAGIGGAVAGSIVQALSGVVGIVSSGLGTALSAIGSAVGGVGKALGDALGNVNTALSDMIQNAQQFATAALSVQRGSGFSLAASSQVAGLSQVLTGGPGAFGSTFSNFGMMSQYLGARARSEGEDVSGKSFLEYTRAMFDRYQSLGSAPEGAMRRQILLNVGFPGSQGVIGNLFSLGPDMVNKALRVAQQIAPTDKQIHQDANLGFNLQVIGAQLDGIKLKFLSDLLPAVNLFVGAFSKLFSANEDKIVAGLSAFGEWMYVKFPSALTSGLSALFSFGEAFAKSFPKIFEVGLTVLEGFITTVQKIAGELAGPVGLFSKTAGSSLRAFSNIGLDKMGLETPASLVQRDTAARRRAQADAAQDEAERIQAQLKEKSGVRKVLNPETGRYDTEAYGMTPAERTKATARLTELDASRKRLLAEADRADAERARINPLQQKAQKLGDAAGDWMRGADGTSSAWLRDTFGTERQRYHDYHNGVGVPPPGGGTQLQVTGEIHFKHDIDLDSMRHSVTQRIGKQQIRAIQRGGA